jgi:AcrR family transcriptional regulator
MQRSRLLAATVRMVDELGYADATVSRIALRARVSRRTFYELFANREECVAAVLEDTAQRIRSEIEGAGLGERSWRERVRGGLWTILSFLDREPVLARVCVVQALRGSQELLECREEILRGLVGALDAGRHEGARGGECPPLTGEGLVGAAFTIVYARLLHGREPLTGLLGELMGMIVLPYLGPAAARRELALPVPVSPRRSRAARDGNGVEHDPLEGIPMRLTYRTWRVLSAIGEQPGANNREVATAAGVADQGQISKLLTRLERLGLIHNTTITTGRGGNGHRPSGEPNAWSLTTRGGEIERITTRVQTDRAHTQPSNNRDGGVR